MIDLNWHFSQNVCKITAMLSHSLFATYTKNRVMRSLVALALIFSAVHVVLHEADTVHGGQSECQLCQLNHTSTVVPSTVSVFSTPALLLYIFDISQFESPVLFSYLPHWARAPPLF